MKAKCCVVKIIAKRALILTKIKPERSIVNQTNSWQTHTNWFRSLHLCVLCVNAYTLLCVRTHYILHQFMTYPRVNILYLNGDFAKRPSAKSNYIRSFHRRSYIMQCGVQWNLVRYTLISFYAFWWHIFRYPTNKNRLSNCCLCCWCV